MSSAAARIVYVVDDDEGVRDSTAELLRAVGMEVRHFDSGRAFLEKLDPDSRGCVLLDLHMPVMSGLQTLDALRRTGSTMPVILFTGRTEAATMDVTQHAGAVAVLPKPADHAEMIPLIENLLERGET